MSVTRCYMYDRSDVNDTYGFADTCYYLLSGRNCPTRRFRNIMREMESAIEVHHQNNSHLGGIHLELTGENVTECTGGARNLNEADLGRAYKSIVDPRLNYEQALELAMLIVRKFGKLA